MINIGAMLAKFGIDHQQFSAGIKTISTQALSFNKAIGLSSTVVNKFRANINALKSPLGSIGMMFGGLGLAKVTKDLIALGAGFERMMNVVKGVTFAGEILSGSKSWESAFNRMTAAARHYGETTEWTASQAAESLKYLSMAGLKAEQSLAALPHTLDLATAGQLALGEAADISTNIMTQMRLEAEELSRVNDSLVWVQANYNTNVREAAEAWVYAGTKAASFGVEVEELAVMIGVLANAGVKASMAGTTLRQSMIRLLDPSKESQEILNKHGVALRNNSGEIKTFTELLYELTDAQLDQVEIAKLFGARAGNIEVLMRLGSDALREYVKETIEAKGVAKSMADVFRSDLTGQWRTFVSAVQEVTLSLYDEFRPRLQTFIKDATTWVRANKMEFVEWADTISEKTKGIYNWLDEHPNLMKYGLLGLLIRGKLGVAVATMGFVKDELNALDKWIKDKESRRETASLLTDVKNTIGIGTLWGNVSGGGNQYAAQETEGFESAKRYYAGVRAAQVQEGKKLAEESLALQTSIWEESTKDRITRETAALKVKEEMTEKERELYEEMTVEKIRMAKGETEAKIQELKFEYEEKQKTIENVKLLDEWYNVQLKKLLKEREEEYDKTNKVVIKNAKARLTEEMSIWEESTDDWVKRQAALRKSDADDEKKRKKDAKEAKAAYERQKKQFIDLARKGGDFTTGMVAGLAEMQEKLTTFGEMGYQVFQTFVSSTGDLFHEGITGLITGDLDTLQDSFSNWAQSIAETFINMISKMVAEWATMQIASALGLGNVAAGAPGGVTGMGGTLGGGPSTGGGGSILSNLGSMFGSSTQGGGGGFGGALSSFFGGGTAGGVGPTGTAEGGAAFEMFASDTTAAEATSTYGAGAGGMSGAAGAASAAAGALMAYNIYQQREAGQLSPTSGALQGAMAGAMMGAYFGPYGIAIGAVVGGIAGAVAGSGGNAKYKVEGNYEVAPGGKDDPFKLRLVSSDKEGMSGSWSRYGDTMTKWAEKALDPWEETFATLTKPQKAAFLAHMTPWRFNFYAKSGDLAQMQNEWNQTLMNADATATANLAPLFEETIAKYHKGGVIGRDDERLILGQVGERMLSRDEYSRIGYEQGVRGAMSGSSGGIHVHLTLNGQMFTTDDPAHYLSEVMDKINRLKVGSQWATDKIAGAGITMS